MPRRQRRQQFQPCGPPAASLDVWRDRRQMLGQLLQDNPQCEWAWLWRTRIKVLDYLLERHATHEAPQTTPSHDHSAGSAKPSEHRLPPPESTSPYDQNPLDASRLERESLIDRPAIQSRLGSLHKINEDRRAQQPPIRPTPPPRRPEWRLVPVQPTLPEVMIHNCWQAIPEGLRKLLLSEIDPRTLRLKRPESLVQLPPPFKLVPMIRSSQKAEPALRELVDTPALDSAAALAEMDERDYKALRQLIAIDLGLSELSDEMLDEQTIRAILAEHGLEPEEPG